MSTCPRCGGYLSRHHRCRRGKRVLRSIGYGVAGALVGCLLTFMLVNRPAEPLLFIMAILGSILTLAARRYARF